VTRAEHERVIPRREPQNVQVPGLVEVKAGSITYGSASDLRRRATEVREEARQTFYTNELISLFLVEPELSPDQVAKLPDVAIEALLPHAAALKGLSDLLPNYQDLSPRERLYRAWDDKWRARDRQLLELAESYRKTVQASVQGIAGILASIQKSQDFFANVARSLEFANNLVRPRALEGLMPSIQLLESTRLKVPTVPQDFLDRTLRIAALDTPIAYSGESGRAFR
jgi:hypothetical protein